MEFADAVRRRRMCRSFRDDPVDPALIDRLLAAAQRAPSAGNTQGWQFLVLDDDTARRRYWDTTLPEARRARFPWPGLLRAPVLVVPCAEPGAYVRRYGEPDKAARVAASDRERAALASTPESWPVPYWWVDTGMACQNLLLAATDAGLGSCLFGLFEHEPAVRAAFGVPDGFRPVATIALGHPDEVPSPGTSPRRRPRPPLDDVVHCGGW